MLRRTSSHPGFEGAEARAVAMLVAYRLAGLSALEAQYADINARTQCEAVRLHVGVEERRRP